MSRSIRVLRARVVIAASLVFFFASTTFAQTIVDGRRLEFPASTDHNAVDPGGVALLTSYRVDVYVAGSASPQQSAGLGKPAPDPDGLVRLDFVALLSAPLTAGTIYEARVVAIGPGGSSASPPSNTFGFSPVCAPAPASTSASMPSGGGTGSVGVTAGAGCGWTAVSNAAWITVTSGAAGSGPGSVGYSVAANSGTTSRTGTITIAGATFTVTQAAVTCSFTVSPLTTSIVAAGGSGSATVTTTAGCAWTASENATWLSITAGASGSGNGTVTFSATANSGSAARSATMAVAGATVTVNQAGVSCTPSLSGTGQSFPAAGGTGTVSITTPAGCAWTAASSAGWLTVTSGASGSGNGTVGFSAAANTSATARSATLTVGGLTFTVQEAAGCGYTVSPASASIASTGGTAIINVSAAAGCSWTATGAPSWLTVSGGGTGNGTVVLTASGNNAASTRSATLTIAGQGVAVSQAGKPTPNAPSNLRIVR